MYHCQKCVFKISNFVKSKCDKQMHDQLTKTVGRFYIVRKKTKVG